MFQFSKYQTAVSLQVPVSKKVVNRKLCRTSVFAIYDRFTKLTDFLYVTFFITNYRLGRSSRKS